MSDTPVVILCRPQIGENIGATARAMANFGLVDLRLVRPDCGWPNAKAVAAASGAMGVLNDIERFDALTPAVADLHHIFATTARPRELRKDVLTAEEAAARARALIAQGRRVGFMFGAERTGLTNEELLLADAIVSIPTSPRFASLNLGQAVLVCAYEWHRSGQATETADVAGGQGRHRHQGRGRGPGRASRARAGRGRLLPLAGPARKPDPCHHRAVRAAHAEPARGPPAARDRQGPLGRQAGAAQPAP